MTDAIKGALVLTASASIVVALAAHQQRWLSGWTIARLVYRIGAAFMALGDGCVYARQSWLRYRAEADERSMPRPTVQERRAAEIAEINRLLAMLPSGDTLGRMSLEARRAAMEHQR